MAIPPAGYVPEIAPVEYDTCNCKHVPPSFPPDTLYVPVVPTLITVDVSNVQN